MHIVRVFVSGKHHLPDAKPIDRQPAPANPLHRPVPGRNRGGDQHSDAARIDRRALQRRRADWRQHLPRVGPRCVAGGNSDRDLLVVPGPPPLLGRLHPDPAD